MSFALFVTRRMLNPMGICPRPLANIETQSHRKSAKTPRYAFNMQYRHQDVDLSHSLLSLHAFALPVFAERENLDTRDWIS